MKIRLSLGVIFIFICPRGVFLYQFCCKIFGGVTGYFFRFYNGLLLISRVGFSNIVKGNVTPYFYHEKCHGLLSCHGLLFWKMSQLLEKCHGEKNVRITYGFKKVVF